MRHRPSWLLFALALHAGCSASHDLGGAPDAAPIVDAAISDAAPAIDAAGSATCGSTPVGSPCSTDVDCTVHASFSTATCLPPAHGATMGYCSAVCMVDGDCGACGHCVANELGAAPAPGWYGMCARACDPATPCRAGYVCAAIDAGRSACFPDCRAQPGLCGAARCNAASGSCDLGCSLDTDCSAGSRCAAGRCVCGPTTACLAGHACDTSGGCGCTGDAACGPGHACTPMIGCCAWGPGFCG